MVEESTERPIARELRSTVPFLIVGTIGYFVDATILSALTLGAGWSPYLARMLSFGTAVSVTWQLNRTWTFARYQTAQRGREYVGYLAVQFVGATINYLVFSACVYVSPFMRAVPPLPLAIGSVVALAFNYFGLKALVYRVRTD